MGAVVRGQLARGAIADRRPRFVVEHPVTKPSRTQLRDVRIRCHRGLEERVDGDATRVFPQLLLQDVTGCAALQRLAHGGVVTWMLARRHSLDLATGDRPGPPRYAQGSAAGV